MSKYFYVIMPIGCDPDLVVKKDILCRKGQDYGIEPHFPFDNVVGEFSSVLEKLTTARFVFADLSYERPSCYYEVGLAEALAKPVMIVARKGTTIHQLQNQVRIYETLDDYACLVEKAIDQYRL